MRILRTSVVILSLILSALSFAGENCEMNVTEVFGVPVAIGYYSNQTTGNTEVGKHSSVYGKICIDEIEELPQLNQARIKNVKFLLSTGERFYFDEDKGTMSLLCRHLGFADAAGALAIEWSHHTNDLYYDKRKQVVRVLGTKQLDSAVVATSITCNIR